MKLSDQGTVIILEYDQGTALRPEGLSVASQSVIIFRESYFENFGTLFHSLK